MGRNGQAHGSVSGWAVQAVSVLSSKALPSEHSGDCPKPEADGSAGCRPCSARSQSSFSACPSSHCPCVLPKGAMLWAVGLQWLGVGVPSPFQNRGVFCSCKDLGPEKDFTVLWAQEGLRAATGLAGWRLPLSIPPKSQETETEKQHDFPNIIKPRLCGPRTSGKLK